MKNLNLISRLGIFSQKFFLDSESCKKYLFEVNRSSGSPAQLRKDGIAIKDYSHRQTTQLKISASVIHEVKGRLIAIKPELEKHFRIKLDHVEGPLFYLYETGDFIGIHKDVNPQDSMAPETEKNRVVSVVIFLNQQSEAPAPDTYGGGNLTFYGLIKDPRWATYGFPLIGEPGTLIAFPSDVIHEVKPVIHGKRYTIVSWFSQEIN